jgi:hypothetical protein
MSGGYISSLLAGVPYVGITIADPGSVTKLDALRQKIRPLPGVVDVAPYFFPIPSLLPPNPSFQAIPPKRLEVISHHLAVRANAAWNASSLLEKNALAGKAPTIFIRDSFGDGGPTAIKGFNVDYIENDYDSRGPLVDSNGNPSYHGYDVLSIIASSFGGVDDRLGIATGIVPFRLRVRAFDLQLEGGGYGYMGKIVSAVKAERELGHNVILNSSLGQHGTSCPPSGTCPDLSKLSEDVIWGEYEQGWLWAGYLRHDNFQSQAGSNEFDFLHTVSAGNNGLLPAFWASGEARFSVPEPNLNLPGVALRDFATHKKVESPAGSGNYVIAPFLANTLIVEGRQGVEGVSASLQPIKPYSLCVDDTASSWTSDYKDYSTYGGHISGIGDMIARQPSGVFDELGIYLPFEPMILYGSGSSFASPQVAGVAALVWTARPDLSMQQVRQILLKTAGGVHTTSDTTPCSNADTDFYHSPVDAYAAILAADCPDFNCDLGTSATPDNSPVRLAILDIATADNNGNLVGDPDGHFTQADILKFLQEFQSRRGASFDYSRFDLNGDGTTNTPNIVRPGQTYVAQSTYFGSRRFDLNGDGQFATATQSVEGVTMTFDENKVTDLEVLVYYAYSPLYEGNEYERTLLLLPYLDWANAPSRNRPSFRQMNFQLSNLTGVNGNTWLDTIKYQGSSADAPTAGLWGGRFISPCGQELGAPLYSQEVQTAATGLKNADDVWAPTWWASTNPVNTPPAGTVAKRCSDFIAAVPSTGKMWINISQVMDNEPNREYQVRLYLGEPDLLAPKTSGFTPGLKRQLTQSGVYGYVDTKVSGNFIGGMPNSDFQLLGIGFAADTLYRITYRN